MMHETCATCGAGRRIAEATFELEHGQVRWTMWSCGHAERVLIGAASAVLTAAGMR